MNQLQAIVEPLVQWYQKNKRILPWRIEKDPYKIWISEIMLQQTRIEAVKEYYHRFMLALPTVNDLASIKEEKLLKLWQGLGYYNRARNLKKAATIIKDEYHGIMPSCYDELVKLPGIGEYTAGAIASIAYNEKVTAVDGNVLRVISRIIGSRKNVLEESTKKEITAMLTSVIPKEAGDFNEGLMELGETICLPNQDPLCEKCPLKQYCYAYENNVTSELPVREKKQKKETEGKTVFLFMTEEGKIAIRKRPDKGLLAGLYEFPNVDKILEEKEIEQVAQTYQLKIESIKKAGKYKHIFTHKIWQMHGHKAVVSEENKEFLWVTMEQLKKEYPIPTAFQPFVKLLEKIQ